MITEMTNPVFLRRLRGNPVDRKRQTDFLSLEVFSMQLTQLIIQGDEFIF